MWLRNGTSTITKIYFYVSLSHELIMWIHSQALGILSRKLSFIPISFPREIFRFCRTLKGKLRNLCWCTPFLKFTSSVDFAATFERKRNFFSSHNFYWSNKSVGSGELFDSLQSSSYVDAPHILLKKPQVTENYHHIHIWMAEFMIFRYQAQY